MEQPLTEARPRKCTRIHISFKDKSFPYVFNFNQLLKREQQKETDDFIPLINSNSNNNNSEDSFYESILKKAESYVPSDEDDGSDDDNLPIGKKGEDYDFADPFIDDSEMLMEEPEDYVLPEFDGFFAYHGPLDGSEGNTGTEKKQASRKTNTAKGKSAASSSTNKKTDTKTSRSVKKTGDDAKQKKPAPVASGSKTTSDQAAKKAGTETKKAAPSSTASNSTIKKKPSDKESVSTAVAGPVDLTSDTESTSASTGGEKKKPQASTSSTSTELEPLDDEVAALMETLRGEVKSEMFATKSKFPSALKRTVFKIGLVLLHKYKTIDDNAVSHLMKVLPYNRYTIKKLLATKSGQMRIDELQGEIDEMAIQLKRKIDTMMPEQIKAYNDKVAQQLAKGETATNEEDEEKENVEKKFRCNEDVRKLLFDIMKADEQSVAVTNLIATITKKPDISIAEGKARKAMYQRLLSCWPEGWMNSYEMSRQYSQIKNKVTPSKSKATATSSPQSNGSKSTSTPDKKRKRVTPQSSPDDAARKKIIVTSESHLPSPLKLNQTQPTIIDLDNDDEPESSSQLPQQSSASMKIESLISGPK